MFDHFLAGFEEFHCETIWTWGLSVGHLLDHLVNFLLSDGFVYIDILFLDN
jgi:hypothetical protein